MKDEFNIWDDIFGYHDIDGDGDIDITDAMLEDDDFEETERYLRTSPTNEEFDLDDDFEDEDLDVFDDEDDF